MIEFESEDFNDFASEMQLKSTEISIEIARSICNAMDENLNHVSFGFLSKLNLDVIASRQDWLEALEINLPRIEEAEEYELCNRIIDCINILKAEKDLRH